MLKRKRLEDDRIDNRRKGARSSLDVAGSTVVSGPSIDSSTRRELRAELLAASRATKTSVASILMTLQERGILNDPELGKSNERHRLREAVEYHAKAMTPYGSVVQKIEVPLINGKSMTWEIIHPFAFLYYLTSVCQGFAIMMNSCLQQARGKFTLVMYGDEITPGNPMRVDKGRQLPCFYYTFIQWPTWLLHRKDGWMAFGSIRTRFMKQILGGHSALMKLILKIMFVDGGANFTNGFFVLHKGVERVCTAGFGGILSDEKALKEFFDIKGQAGCKPCIQCKNISNFIHKSDDDHNTGYVRSLACADRLQWVAHTNNSVYKMIDRLRQANASDRQILSSIFGVNLNIYGLLTCEEPKSIVKPIDHYCRDWQHTLLSSGVAGSHVAALMNNLRKSKTLKRVGITLDTLRQYAAHFISPRRRGKLNENWFHTQILGKDHVKAFASDVMTMVPILDAFMQDIIALAD